ncbi:GNAT family N-acetyltransferase [Dyadobacter fermentans]|uniref:GNAT family N-acetyltransferase n=1 Tax=Dyadobacter fermentans TaxID=94254 RepID=UPI001CC10852|nr:GNAT family N-acetyltransferase [Dyadobacter fermentans]MBZ1359929.1 N-acetyltransferase [Dyadobacter fermentans]
MDIFALNVTHFKQKFMAEIKFKLDNRRRGAFYVEEDGKQVGEMVIGLSETTLTVYHTEVDPAMEGRGLARKMLDAMVAYAREHGLQVLPLCEYVHGQFRRHPEEFEDIWQKR